jgi:hypothetical protein
MKKILRFEDFRKLYEEFNSDYYDDLLDKYNDGGEESLTTDELNYLKSGGESEIPGGKEVWLVADKADMNSPLWFIPEEDEANGLYNYWRSNNNRVSMWKGVFDGKMINSDDENDEVERILGDEDFGLDLQNAWSSESLDGDTKDKLISAGYDAIEYWVPYLADEDYVMDTLLVLNPSKSILKLDKIK